MKGTRYVEVAVDLPLTSTFHYQVPQASRQQATVGKRVWVPFRNRQLLGMVVGRVKRPEVARVKPIGQVIDEEPVLDGELLDLTRWMAEVYQAGWGETIRTALPGPLRRGRFRMESRVEEAPVAVIPSAPHTLNTEQERALKPILQAIARQEHQTFLLHGVTASGKTEVYLQAIQDLISRGRSAIVLVPEISLTPQTIERFQSRFGREAVAVLHSGMLESQRLKEWHRIRSSEVRVVVGARSALFAPVRSLGLIVLDEEHEPSYKQADSPRYHAREVAIRRGELARAPVILGSATPSVESYYQAHRGYHLLELRERIEEVPLPEVQIVDMRREFGRGRRGKIFSRSLEEAIGNCLQQKEQAILFLNRRGFSTFVQCRSCGQVLKCSACQVSLNYHIATQSLVCHYCHASSQAPEICPHCQSEYVRFQGIGTQRVESELARIFPQARIARMDTDATRLRGSHARILNDFKEHKIDILVGTQMVAKGLDFPRVTLVGVISDTALHLADFRSAERTFNLLTQVAGRAGRGRLPGRVIVQTYTPHHYAIQAASRHDYQAFYAQEIAARRQLRLPPFSRLVQLTVRSLKESKAFSASQEIEQVCRQRLPSEVEILGPAPAMIHRIRRQYRWQLLLKGPSLDSLTGPLAAALRHCTVPRGCYLAVDVDPLS
ncbi:MAG: primosomal protein N' [Candidatus Omnitrophica bacterium]|nr:primosomal protein N' [Candidatus Omnitrophota bacterium]